MVKRDPDNTALVRLADDVASVASHVNDSIRERENRNYLWEIQEVFRPPLQLVAAHRMFVREGDLLIRRNHVRRRKARYFFLCSDLLVQAKRVGSSEFNRVIMLRPLRVQRVTALILELCAVVLPGRNDDKRVSVLYHSPLLLEAPSVSDADGWCTALEDCIAGPHIVASSTTAAGKRTSLVASTTVGGGRSVGSSELAALSGFVALGPHEYEVAFEEEGPLGLGLETGENFDVVVKGKEAQFAYSVFCECTN